MRAATIALFVLCTVGGRAAAQDRPPAADSAAALYRQAMALHTMGGAANRERAIVLLLEAAGIYDSYGAASSAAQAVHNVGTIHLDAGRLDSALHYLVGALGVYSRLDKWEAAGPTLLNLGHVARRLGQPDSALIAYRTAAGISARYGDASLHAAAVHGYGSTWADLEQQDSAIVYYRFALDAWRVQGERMREADVLSDLAHAMNARGDTAEALALLRQALPIYLELGNVEGQQRVQVNITKLERRPPPDP